MPAEYLCTISYYGEKSGADEILLWGFLADARRRAYERSRKHGEVAQYHISLTDYNGTEVIATRFHWLRNGRPVSSDRLRPAAIEKVLSLSIN